MDKLQKVTCFFTDETSLYKAYMPFVKGGGLFIRTTENFHFGDTISLLIKLVNEEQYYEINGKVVWITPKGAQGNKVPGIGVQLLGKNSRNLCNKIETYLAGMLKSPQQTDTF